jgi:hypothetical protein
MPDGGVDSLYPQPVAQPQSLLSNPQSLVSAVEGITRLGILQQQAGALGQIPQQQLIGQQIQNQTAQIQQQDAMRKAYTGAVVNSLAGIKNPKPDDVDNAVTNFSRQYPAAAVMGMPNAVADQLKAGGDIAGNVKRGMASLLSPEGAAQRVTAPPDQFGAPQSQSLAAQTAQGTTATGLPLGADKSSEIMQGDLARAKNFGQEIFPWQQALQKLQALGPGGTAPGSAGRQAMESYVYGLSPTIARWAGIDPEKIRNYAEADKYLTQATQQRAAGFGAHTDMQLATTISGSPNVHINDLSNVDVTKAAIALRRMEQVQTLEAAKVGGPGYTAEAARLAPNLDPRAFLIDQMDPQQVDKLKSSLTGSDKAKFNASLGMAYRDGVIKRPGT